MLVKHDQRLNCYNTHVCLKFDWSKTWLLPSDWHVMYIYTMHRCFIQAFGFGHSIIHWFVPSFPSRLHSVSFLCSFHSCIHFHASIYFHSHIHFHLCFYFHFYIYDHSCIHLLSCIHFHSWKCFIHFQSSFTCMIF